MICRRTHARALATLIFSTDFNTVAAELYEEKGDLEEAEKDVEEAKADGLDPAAVL